MGLTIHYSGSIADKRKLPQLIEEVEEIARFQGWKYNVYEREFPDKLNLTGQKQEQHDGKLYGIDFTPEGSESVSICFLSNGRMSSIMQLACWGEFKGEKPLVLYHAELDEDGEVEIESEVIQHTAEDFKRYLYMCSAKTQYAGPDTHELIIGVMRYLAKTYLADFKLTDESELWETEDRALMHRNFERTGRMIDSFGESLNNENRLPGEDIESFIRRIMEEFRKKK